MFRWPESFGSRPGIIGTRSAFDAWRLTACERPRRQCGRRRGREPGGSRVHRGGSAPLRQHGPRRKSDNKLRHPTKTIAAPMQGWVPAGAYGRVHERDQAQPRVDGNGGCPSGDRYGIRRGQPCRDELPRFRISPLRPGRHWRSPWPSRHAKDKPGSGRFLVPGPPRGQ